MLSIRGGLVSRPGHRELAAGAACNVAMAGPAIDTHGIAMFPLP